MEKMEKMNFDDFTLALSINDQTFARDLHSYMLANGCKATFEEKKTSLLGSYKHTKTKKTVINVLAKKHGLLVRIYGENFGKYSDFLNTLPTEMVESINKAGDCGRLVNNTCGPKCTGYDFTIDNKRFQKCRYNCFEFLVTNDSNLFIKTFVEHELTARND